VTPGPAFWAKSSNLFLWLWLGCTVLELIARRASRRDLGDATRGDGAGGLIDLEALRERGADHLEGVGS